MAYNGLEPIGEAEFWWRLRATFSTKLPRDGDLALNPLAREARISSRGVSVPTLTAVDDNGQEMRNTADDLLSFEDVRSTRVYDVATQIAGGDYPQWLYDLEYGINNATHTIKGVDHTKYTLRLMHVKIDTEQYENGVWFYPVSYELHFDPLTHFWRPVNQGHHEYQYIDRTTDPKNPKVVPPSDPNAEKDKVRIVMDDGTYPSRETMLDGDGRAILAPQLGQVVVLAFQPSTRRAVNFNLLPH